MNLVQTKPICNKVFLTYLLVNVYSCKYKIIKLVYIYIHTHLHAKYKDILFKFMRRETLRDREYDSRLFNYLILGMFFYPTLILAKKKS